MFTGNGIRACVFRRNGGYTLIWARIAAVFANKAEPKTLNRATGVVLVILGAAIMTFNLLK